MATKDNLRKIFEAGYPLVEQWLDAAEQIAALREVATEAGLDWSQIKSLLKAKVQDDRDDSGTTKRITRIVDKAESASAYADMLGLAKVNENICFSEERFDPETGEILEDRIPKPATEAAAAAREDSSIGKRSGGDASLSGGAGRGDGMASEPMRANVSEGVTAGRVPALNNPREEGAAHAEEAAPAIRAVNSAPTRETLPEIPAFLRRTKPPPELVE